MAEKLAIDGGQKVYNGVWPAWPTFNEKVYDKVTDILKSGKVNYWTGKIGMEFEKAWAKWLGVNNAIS
ncbi:MAG: DegT/DnrJ/EryC1/StrS family aminotransferase, partial [Lentisphaerae bacterium]|nr:DegT/DnrJ/EryC1/StrS family aminotransferase [Lentisphaerota bacterium]